MAAASPPMPPLPKASTLSPSFASLIAPLEGQLPHITPLESKSNRPLRFSFNYQLRALIYYHTEAFSSAQDLLQATAHDPLARALLCPRGDSARAPSTKLTRAEGLCR